MSSLLNGRTAVVTGGGTGIGRGIAIEFAEAGADVGVNHPPGTEEEAKATEVVEKIEEVGQSGVTLEADVGDPEAVQEMVSTVKNELGLPDILVNNAGILEPCPLTEMPIDLWDETMRVDLRGVFLPTRYLLPEMQERGSGKIINIASQLGFIGREEMVHYSAAKGGVIAFTRALAQEVSPEINVNAIAPGPIDTGIVDTDQEAKQELAESLPMKRIGTADDVVPSAVFLASPQSDYYTGQTLSPDGGDAMH